MKKTVRTALNANLSATAVAAKADLVLLPVLPASPFTTNPDVDGRSGIQFVYDANSLIDAYAAKGRKANLNIEHAYTNGVEDTRSRGYCTSLTTSERETDQGMEPGVLYGWFRTSELGAAELAARLWLYTSAELRGTWLEESVFSITKFLGHALTNNPATEMPANFTADTETEEAEDASSGAGYTNQLTAETQLMLLSLLLQYLGLPAETTEDQAAVALQALINEEASEVAEVAEVAETAQGMSAQAATEAHANLTAVTEQAATLSAQVGALTAELTAKATELTATTAELTAARAVIATAQSAEAERLVFAAVDSAIAARKATPAQRDALARIAKADLSAFNDAMSAAPVVLTAGTETVSSGSAAAAVELTPEEKAYCKSFGFKEASFLRAKQSARN